MPSLVILGAGGFVGLSLLSAGQFPMPITAVARSIPPNAAHPDRGITWLAADLSIPTSLHNVLSPGDVVINLAYRSDAGEAENVAIIDNIVEACLRSRAARLVHCSTAAVAGAAQSSRLDETCPCVPSTPYEQTKWVLEQRVLSALSRGIDVGILRPTAIVGPGSQNLLKLAKSLQNGSRLASYLRASLFGRRPMHLVPVRDVAAALLHLATLPGALDGNIFIVSADDDPKNDFLSVEDILLRAMGRGSRTVPPVPVPRLVLSLLLRLRGRSGADVSRRYDASKLLATNFRRVDSVAGAVCEFGRSARSQ